MSLKIRKTTGEVFDLPTDYVIEAEKNNPLFTNKGSKTVPVHFPNTDNNRKLLLNSDRLDRKDRPDKTFPVIVESDASQQIGLMAINAPFNAGIGFDESEFYNQMSTILLRNLSNLPSLTLGGATTEQRLNSMLSHLTAVMKEQLEADYYVFPIVLEVQEVDDVPYNVILNEVETKVDVSNLPYGRTAELLALNNRIIDRYIDGEIIKLDAPKGYGISPFLKVYKVLEFIFDHFGFKVEENPFKDHRQLKKLVVFNNVMDAILTGTLHYQDMMPDITVKGFLDGLFNKFGMQYFINSNSRTVKIKFLKDTLIPYQSGKIYLDNFKMEEPQINYSSPKQLKLIANREIEMAKTPFNTFEEFLSEYNYQFTDIYGEESWADGVSSVFQTSISKYSIFDQNRTFELHSSDFFDWDKKEELPYEEIKMDDLCLQLGRYNGNYYYLFYLVGYKHLYSDVIVSGKTMNEENANQAKLAFAFAWGKTKYTASNKFNYFFASQINRNENGRFIYDSDGNKFDISLTCNREDGLFNRFWKEYDSFLRHSNFEVKCKLKLSDTDIFNFDMFKTALINNQPLLPKQIKYKLNKKDTVSECAFQTLRLYEPYDLEKEQAITQYIPQKYFWDWDSVSVPDPESFGNYHIISGQTIEAVWIGGVAVPTSRLLMPPTEEEFQTHQQRITVYKYTIKPSNPLLSNKDIIQTVTYTPKKIEY
ncbi:MAG: hypothetical protein LBJ72_02985 [Dysgonamonadaceae bacterium]|jgi:hypothetical protein|nr:hypothetical protein [Dysgonamonadaceae bacterium]